MPRRTPSSIRTAGPRRRKRRRPRTVCPSCGAALGASPKFCPECGSPLAADGVEGRFRAGCDVRQSLPDRRGARPRRDGRGLPRRRPRARAAGRAEVPARARSRTTRARSSVPRRGARWRGRSPIRTCAASTTSARRDGELYLSMEYVDGEDLASLLRRIGRLPLDKAIEIARQLCAVSRRRTTRACCTATSSRPTS